MSSTLPAVSAGASDVGATSQNPIVVFWSGCPTEPHYCASQFLGASSPGTVYDFIVRPATVYAQNCTGQSQNSNILTTMITPAACLANSARSKCAEQRVSGNIDFVVGSPKCVFNLGNPTGSVTYFVGPKLPNGTAGTFDMTFDLFFDIVGTDIARYVTATAQCP